MTMTACKVGVLIVPSCRSWTAPNAPSLPGSTRVTGPTRRGRSGRLRRVSPHPSPAQPDLTGLDGEYALRVGTRAKIAALVGSLVLAALLLLGAVLVHDRQLMTVAIGLLVLAAVISWRTRRRQVTTTISHEGITINQGSGQRSRTHIAWNDVQEVYVAGAWQAHSRVRTATHRDVPLPGLGRGHATKLAEALRAVR